MIRVVTAEQMRAIEAEAVSAGVSYAQMMETAGRAVAERVKFLMADFPEPRVAVLVGPGNNGGDGLVAGRVLAQETNATVGFFLTKRRSDDDENWRKVREANLFVVDAEADAEQGYRVLRTLVANADIIVDALLGTGTKLPLHTDMVKVLRQVQQAIAARIADRPRPAFVTPALPEFSVYRRPLVVAVDLPTGLDSDSGALDQSALAADETITFEAAKAGLLAGSADAVGALHVASLQLPEKLPSRDSIKHTLLDAASVLAVLPSRLSDSNKGTFGKAMIVAGSANYLGAPALAALAAYRIGAGLVTVAAPELVVPVIAAQLMEATYLVLPDESGIVMQDAAGLILQGLEGYSALLVGPGLGQDAATWQCIKDLLAGQLYSRSTRRAGFTGNNGGEWQTVKLPPLVLDADALNLLAKVDEWWNLLPARTVITPHPGEMARLALIQPEGERKPNEVVQSARLKLATESAARWNCIVVLKGAHTVIADPDGRAAISPFASAALARAGTGDVLAGMIAGLIAQGLDPFDAACAGTYLHGLAGVIAAQMVGSKASVIASDVIQALGDALSSVEQSG
jgi:hydroxyethylthiazole kinase-like uncharacterized protein yjeF